jgi:PTH1 family peptidyl-tRNA hydrolase
MQMQRTLLIGLGNPGEEHAGTYHNVGWELLDFLKIKLEESYGPAPLQKGKKFHFRTCGNFNLIYPDTYMNLSGEAVKAALAWFHKKPEDAVIFQDDSDLTLGEHKSGPLSGSGDAGHRGISSVMSSIPPTGEPESLRVRIGIRDPRENNGEHPRRKAGDFVLKRISKEDQEKLREVFRELSLEFIESA